MKSNFKVIWITLILAIACLLLTMCMPPEERGNVLLINQYHEPITRVVVENRIRSVNILQGDNFLLDVTLDKAQEIYVITSDLRVSNSIRVVAIGHAVEIIFLTVDGSLTKSWTLNE